MLLYNTPLPFTQLLPLDVIGGILSSLVTILVKLVSRLLGG